MTELYTRRGSLSVIKEAAINTPLTPTTFVPFNDENISGQYPYMPSSPVAGNRAMNLRAIKGAIPAMEGTINLNIEPKTFPKFLLALLGGLTSGNYVTISNIVGTFNTTNLVTFVGSGATATPAYVGDNYIIFGAITGSPVATDTLSQAVSAATADVDAVDTTVYGHVGAIPAEVGTGETLTLQVNYVDNAIRYMGVRVRALDALGQADNIITAGVSIIAQSQFRHAKVTAITTAGAGAKTITVDQTKGLVAADSIKLYRPGTGFLDFSAASVKTHTIGTVATTTTITITNLETATAVGDLIMLAPQTASYTINKEMPWVGGSQISVGASLSAVSAENVEDFTIVLNNEFESRHAASGALLENRFPTAILQKGVRGNGTFKLYYTDEDFVRSLRLNTAQALKLVVTGEAIGSTDFFYTLRVDVPEAQFDDFNTNLNVDAIVDQDIPYTMFYNSTAGYLARVLVVNDIASY